MDLATGKLASDLMQLAVNIRDEKYGPDTNFHEDIFLEELEDEVVRPLGGEINID